MKFFFLETLLQKFLKEFSTEYSFFETFLHKMVEIRHKQNHLY
jgi:hypothetical protein